MRVVSDVTCYYILSSVGWLDGDHFVVLIHTHTPTHTDNGLKQKTVHSSMAYYVHLLLYNAVKHMLTC
jgi:hypothetical protein